MVRLVVIAFVVALTVEDGCWTGLGRGRGVEIRLELDRERAAVGEVVELRAIAVNHGLLPKEYIDGCGAGLDFEVRSATGERQFLLRDLPSTCPVFDSNILEPGETDTVTYAWTVPGPPGRYLLRAGGRVPSGLASPSEPRVLEIE